MSDVLDGPNAWLVRVAENRVAVGVYFCPLSELANLVDETCDPGACEYIALGWGGVVFAGKPVLPLTDETAETLKETVTEVWGGNFYDDLSWLPIEDE